MEARQLSIRHLAWSCGGLSAGIALFRLAEGREILIALIAALCVCAVCAFFSGTLMRKRAALFAMFFALGLVYTAGWNMIFIEPVLELHGETVYARAKAEDSLRSRADYRYVDVRFELEGRADFTARVYDFDGVLPQIKAGNILEGNFYLSRGDVLHGEDYSGYLSRGVVMLAYPDGEIAVTDSSDILTMPLRISAAVEKLADELFPADVRAFEKALLTGEKNDFYADSHLYHAISYSGLAHVVAVSGMHVSFLVGMIMLFTGAKRAFWIGVPTISLFMLMTGMPPSVVRAGILYIALLAAPLLRREQDGITTLFFALALILLQNPSAVNGIGLQLSFSAMAGILVLAPPIRRSTFDWIRRVIKTKLLRRTAYAAASVAIVSFAANAFSVPLVVWHFGYISVYSLITNVLTNFVVSGIFCLGYAACILGAVSPAVGGALAWVLGWGVRYILFCARIIAGLPGSVVYTENPIFLYWLIFVYVLFAAAWMMKGKWKFRPVFPCCLAVISLCACCLMVNFASQHLASRVTVLDVGQGQSIVMLAQGRAVVVDCGSGGTMENAGDTAGEYLLSRGVKNLDALVLTHIHADHANGAARLMELMEVDKLIIAGKSADEDALKESVLRAAEMNGTEVCCIDSDSRFTAGDIDLTLIAPLAAGQANESGLIVHGGPGDFDVLITGDVGTSTEKELVETKLLPDTELYMVGHHGSTTSSSLRLMEAVRPDFAAVSVGYNSYGHPTAEAISRAIGFGAGLYRTDMNGNLTFYTGENHG